MQPLEPISLSALQHTVYCPRQCALIHVEQAWSENVFTSRGTRAHEKADTLEYDWLDGVRVERALNLWSENLGLIGRADIVEFLQDGSIRPIEYKLGKKKRPVLDANGLDVLALADHVQLCAQALCLEEMFNTSIQAGAIYHVSSKRRREVEFTPTLRSKTLEIIDLTRTMIESGLTPAPVNDNRCPNCSLLEICVPDLKTLKLYDPFVVGDA